MEVNFYLFFLFQFLIVALYLSCRRMKHSNTLPCNENHHLISVQQVIAVTTHCESSSDYRSSLVLFPAHPLEDYTQEAHGNSSF